MPTARATPTLRAGMPMTWAPPSAATTAVPSVQESAAATSLIIIIP